MPQNYDYCELSSFGFRLLSQTQTQVINSFVTQHEIINGAIILHYETEHLRCSLIQTNQNIIKTTIKLGHCAIWMHLRCIARPIEDEELKINWKYFDPRLVIFMAMIHLYCSMLIMAPYCCYWSMNILQQDSRSWLVIKTMIWFCNLLMKMNFSHVLI